MSAFSRRGFIGSAAAAAGMAGMDAAAAGDPSFQNNVPDELLAGRELPTFKFELEKSEGKVIGGSSGKEATVKQLPISKGIAGVSMRLEPGAIRELQACHRGRVGLRDRGPRPDHRDRPRRDLGDQ
jgi:oxalate decarboxylase